MSTLLAQRRNKTHILKNLIILFVIILNLIYFLQLFKYSKELFLDANLKLRQYKLNLMSRFMEIKSVNPKVMQDQIAKELGCSSSTLQRCRQDINMFSLYRNPSISHKRRKKDPKYKPR